RSEMVKASLISEHQPTISSGEVEKVVSSKTSQDEIKQTHVAAAVPARLSARSKINTRPFKFAISPILSCCLGGSRPQTPYDKLAREVESIAVNSASVAVQEQIAHLKDELEKQLKAHEEILLQKVTKLLEKFNHEQGVKIRPVKSKSNQ